MNSFTVTRLGCALLIALSGACSSSSSSPGTPGPVPEAPKLLQLAGMAGGIHVTWEKHSDCDEVEGERKSGTEEYAVVFTAPCTTDNKHDANATSNVDYTYRLRAKNKAGYSAYSAEMTGKPSN